MFKKYYLNATLLILLFLMAPTELFANHKPDGPKIFCKAESERDWWEKIKCDAARDMHGLCNLDARCAIIQLEELKMKVKKLENKIINQTPVNCDSLAFSHVALNNASVFQKPSGNSKVVKNVKKGQQISFVGSTEKKGWIIVVPKDKICTVGYINEKNIGLSTSSGTSTSANPEPPKIKKDKNIKITFPKWKKVGQLITVDQSGFFEIDGFVNKDLAINKVIINYDGDDEEMILGSDGSFNATLQIENSLDVRITTYKNATQIGKALVFKVAVE